VRRLLFALVPVLLPAAAWSLTIKADTRWAGKVAFSEPVRVEPGATLTVAPGSAVTFTGGRLEVAGRLVATGARFSGRDWEGIVLKGCDAATVLRDCTVQGAKTGVQAGGGAPRLEGLTLEGNEVGMELRQKSAATVSGCLFRRNAKVGLFVKDDAVPRVENSRFEANGKFGAYIYRALPTAFSGNLFSGQPTGLMISYFGSDPRVEGNRFEGNELGILVDRAARPQLAGNLLRGNATGIRLYRRSDALLEGNRLEGNQVGVSVAFSSYPQIRGNDFVDNATALLLEFQSSAWERERGSAVRAAEAAGRGAFGQGERAEVTEADRRPRQLDGAVDARDNWWGEAGTAELSRAGADGNPSFIRDGRDTPTFVDGGKSYPLDRVVFAPWSRGPLTDFAAGNSN
jgi:parallel beta-helix repeat protein